MWKTITELLSSVFTLTYRLEKQEQGLKDLQREVKELTAVVQRMAYEQQRNYERESAERQMFMLKVENQLLKANRQLPPGTDEN
jgi:hypothetical protein